MITFLTVELPAYATMGLEISPSRIRIKKQLGESAKGQVEVRNRSSYPIKVTTDITDTVNKKTKDGLLIRDEYPAGMTPYSCAKWIQVLKGEGTVIPPGKSMIMEFVVSPPPQIKEGGFAAYLFIKGAPADYSENQQSEKAGVQVVTIPRLGMSVIYEIEGTVKRTGELASLEIKPPTKTTPFVLRYNFKNTGNADIDLTGSFHIIDSKGNLAAKNTIKGMKTFPGDQGFGETEWKGDLAPGHYSILLTFELGPDATESVVKELPFDIPAAS